MHFSTTRKCLLLVQGRWVKLDLLKNLNEFQRFLIAIAARTGEVVNLSKIAGEIGKDEKTINSWISVLEISGIIYLLRPYLKNDLKRIIKKPKLYFRDTGLACFLTKWNNKEVLMNVQ